MALTVEQKLNNWMRQRLASSPAVTRLELQHTRAEGLPSVVGTWEITDRSHEASERIVTEVWEQADHHASSFGKVQVYSIIAYAEGRGIAEFPLRIRGTGTDPNAGDSEPATAAGQVAQANRHSEAFARMMLDANVKMVELARDMHESMAAHFLAENKRLTDRVEKLEERELKVFQMHEELLTQHAERKALQTKVERGEARKDRLLMKLEKVFPALLSGSDSPTLRRLAGAASESPPGEKETTPDAKNGNGNGEAKPETASVDPVIDGLTKFAESLTEEDGAKLRESVPPATLKRIVDVLGMLFTHKHDPDLIKAKVRSLVNSFQAEDNIPRKISNAIGAVKASKLTAILVGFISNDEQEETT